jgi:hypothetical protein
MLGIDGYCIIGRTWEEFNYAINKISEYCGLGNGVYLPIYVHNLAYEFQFIKDFFEFTNILATNELKIIAAETDQLVFRCSYRLSNMGLDKFLQNERIEEEYQKTHMDYLVERFPWTPLTPEEEEYCRNDVIGLHKAIESRISYVHNADINNLPLTSTGYVRKDCRKAFNEHKTNRWRFYKEQLSVEDYHLCREAFRGGNTHGNRQYVNKVCKNVGQKDERSAYPAAALLYDMPTKFTTMKTFKRQEFNYFLAHWKKWAMLITVTWKNIRLKNPDLTPVPYLATGKCQIHQFNVFSDTPMALQVDNGRILQCDVLQTTITEVDYRIIRDMYVWDEEKITCVKVSKKKPISKEIKEKILEYFTKKTTLKQDENSPNFDPDVYYMYNQSKANLNGIYGMHVSKICKPEYIMDENHNIIEVEQKEADQLKEYYNSFTNFLSYQYGVWITAYARMMLQEGINCLINKEGTRSDLIYCDTDSIKYLHPEDHEKDIAALNHRRELLAEQRGAYIDYEGKRYYLGIFTDEGKVEKFKTFGAKKYIYGDDEHFKITISGVPKKKGVECIKKYVDAGKYKSPFDLKKGFVFHGIKMTSCYMDHDGIKEYEVEPGKKVKFASNIAMYPSSYTLGLTHDFEILLNEYEDIMND